METKLMFSFRLYIFAYRLAAGDTRLQQYNILVRRFSFVCGCSEGSVGIDVTQGYSGEKKYISLGGIPSICLIYNCFPLTIDYSKRNATALKSFYCFFILDALVVCVSV